MKLLPLSIQFTNQKNNKTKVNNTTVPVRLNYLKKDTVSFSGNFLQDAYENLSETVNSKIVPYYHDNKQIFQSLIDINNKTTAVIETFTKAELELMNKRYSYSDPAQNKSLKPFQPFVERYSAHEDSIKDYNKVKKILSGDFYDSPKVREALEHADKVMKKSNPELEKLTPLYRKYVESMINIDLHNDQETLLLGNKPLLDKFNKLKSDSLKSVAYAYSMQMPEIIKLMKSTKDVEKEVNKPTQSVMKTLKTIEHLQHSADSIVKGINNFESNKQRITAFADEFNKNSNNLPSERDIKIAYAGLAENCDKNTQHYLAKLNDFYKKVYLDEGVKVDFSSIDETLNQEKETVEKLYDLKKSIDQDYINKNNEKVLREIGYDSTDVVED